MDKRSIQVSGATVEEAIQRGLAELGLTRNQVNVEIVEEGRRGILGIGTRDATVRLEALAPASIPTSLPEPQPPAEDAPAAEPPPRSRPQDTQLAPSASMDAADEYKLTPEQVVQVSQQTLSELLNKMGIEAQVVGHLNGGSTKEDIPVVLDVQGEALDILIGHRGKVLNALQHITRLIVSREVEQWVDLVVDVGMYKQRRANSLHKLAQRMAERVAGTHQPVALEPMPPNERREIHLALRDHPDVTTQSVGRGDNRKVTIIPRH
ncbi:MAG: protein jag [Anaerolineae bacterium]|nr:protein jag [Anaerolineae bacterium]